MEENQGYMRIDTPHYLLLEEIKLWLSRMHTEPEKWTEEQALEAIKDYLPEYYEIN